MDDIGQRYLLLALRLGRHVEGLVESYCGPAELREAVDAEALTPPRELHDEALRLRELVEDGSAGAAPAGQRRVAWLAAQLRAMSALARQLGGEELAYVDLVEELFEVPVQREPESTFRAAARRLDDLLPGAGSLADRLVRHDRGLALDAGQLLPVAQRLLDLLRSRTRQDIWLPPGESVVLSSTVGLRSGAGAPPALEARYLGGLRSELLLDARATLSAGTLPHLLARHAYPGLHAESVTKEAVLYREAGLAEASIVLAATPHAFLREGLGELAREIVLTDLELGAELRRLRREQRLAGDVEQELAVGRVRRLLRPALGNAALGLHHDGWSVAVVRDYLADVGLLSEGQVEEVSALLRHRMWRVLPFAQAVAPGVVSEWLQAQGATHGCARLLGEQLSPASVMAQAQPA